MNTQNLPNRRPFRVAQLTVLALVALAFASLPQQAFAEANYVYHERTSADPGCGGQYVTTLNPTSAETYPLRFKVEYQFFTDNARVYYTTDGSTPAGSFGTPSGTTAVVSGAYDCTFGGPLVDVITATIPAQSAGTVVKYIVSAWHSGGGDEIFGNGPGAPCGCGTPTSSSALATVHQYTVGSTTNLYWDSNGSTAGAGGTPTGTWGTDTFWSTVFDGTAATAAWTSGRNAIFSAGSDATSAYTVTLNGTQTANSLVFEEGGLTLTNGTLSLTGAGAYDVASGLNATVGSTVTGTIGYAKTGSGRLVLSSGSSTITGPVSVTGGVLEITSSGNIGGTGVGSGNITLNGGTFRNSAIGVGITFLTGNRGIIIGASGGTIDVPGTGANNIQIYTSGSITGTGNTLTKSGGGTFRNTTPTSITFARLVVTGGLYQAAADTIFGAVPASTMVDQITLNGGGISLNGGVTFDSKRGITLGAAGGTINCSSSLTYAGPISGSGELIKTGASALLLQQAAGVNTYTSNTVILAGDASVNATATFGNGTGTIILGGGNLASANTRPSAPLTNPVLMTNSSSIRSSTTLSSGSRVLPFSSSSISGTTGTLSITNPGSSGTLFQARFTGGGFNFTQPVIIDRNATAAVELGLYNDITTATQTWSGVISGAGTIHRNTGANPGGNTIIANGANTFTGGTQLRAGFIGLGADNCLGTGNVTNGWDPGPLGFFASGGPRVLTNDIVADVANSTTSSATGSTNLQIKGSQNLTLSGRILAHTNVMFFTISNTALTTFSGVITNAGPVPSTFGIVKQGPGTLVFEGANRFAGKTLINNGTLLINNASGSGTSTGIVEVAGGTLGGTGIANGAISVFSGGTLAPGASIGTLTLGSTLSLAGTTTIEVDKGAGQTSDKVLGITTLTEGGALQVANVGAALAAGDNFPVFSAATYTGNFASVTPAPGTGLAWDTEKLRTNGVLLVHNRPVAGNDDASAQHGQTTTIPVAKLLANDSDADTDPLSVTAVSANASLGGGLVTYTAPLTGTSDTITYTLSDGRGGTNAGTINVTLTSSGGSFNQLAAVLLGGGDMELTYLGVPGTNYALDRSFNLTPPVTWVPQITNPAAGNGYLIFTNTPDPSTNNFWRTRYVP